MPQRTPSLTGDTVVLIASTRSGRKRKGQKKRRTVRAIATSETSLPQVARLCMNHFPLSFIQGSLERSMKQQQQRGKSAGSKETNLTAEKAFTESDQDRSDQHTMHGQQVHTSVQQRGIPSIVYSDDLFDKWPPPADMEGRLEADEIAQIKAAMRGQPMQGPKPSYEDLKEWGLTCVEQYHI